MRRFAALVLLAVSAATAVPRAAGADGFTPRRAKVGIAVWFVPTTRPHVYTGYVAQVLLFRDLLQDKTYSGPFADAVETLWEELTPT